MMKRLTTAALLTFAFAWSASADVSPLVIQAEASIKQVRYDIAIDLLNRAIAANPNDSRAYCDRAYAYFGQRDVTHALADCHTAIDLDVNNDSAYSVLGSINWVTGHNDDALADFDEALHLAPTKAIYWYNRGLFYLHKDNTKAIDDFTQALRLNPRDADSWYNRGNAFLEERQYDSAISDFTAGVQFKPRYGNFYHERAFAYQCEGKLDNAIADYTSAIALKPQSSTEYYSRGTAYGEAHDYQHAIADYTTAIQLDPKNPGFYYQRGLCYQQLGDQAHMDADMKETALLKSQAGN
jgi:tetratricopeptide (TPR) repeat protein